MKNSYILLLIFGLFSIPTDGSSACGSREDPSNAINRVENKISPEADHPDGFGATNTENQLIADKLDDNQSHHNKDEIEKAIKELDKTLSGRNKQNQKIKKLKEELKEVEDRLEKAQLRQKGIVQNQEKLISKRRELQKAEEDLLIWENDNRVRIQELSSLNERLAEINLIEAKDKEEAKKANFQEMPQRKTKREKQAEKAEERKKQNDIKIKEERKKELEKNTKRNAEFFSLYDQLLEKKAIAEKKAIENEENIEKLRNLTIQHIEELKQRKSSLAKEIFNEGNIQLEINEDKERTLKSFERSSPQIQLFMAELKEINKNTNSDFSITFPEDLKSMESIKNAMKIVKNNIIYLLKSDFYLYTMPMNSTENDMKPILLNYSNHRISFPEEEYNQLTEAIKIDEASIISIAGLIEESIDSLSNLSIFPEFLNVLEQISDRLKIFFQKNYNKIAKEKEILGILYKNIEP